MKKVMSIVMLAIGSMAAVAQQQFTKEEQERARGTFKGLREHTVEIQSFGSICGPKIMANKEKLDTLMTERIKNFDSAING